jgi:phosphatidylcholine synthase
MAVLIIHGDPASIANVFILMLVATLIDATDGTLARAVRIKQVLPGFDGRRLDDLVDFLTYTFLPLLLLWQCREQLLPAGAGWVLLVPLFASAYGFCQVEAKTADGFFLGFPSYWNLVAFYLYHLRWPPVVNVAVLVLLALLTFVPSRYLYPTQRGWVNRVSNLLAVPWVFLLVWILYRLQTQTHRGSEPDRFTRELTLVSLFYPAYYLLASWLVSVRIRRKQRLAGR